MCLCRRPGIVHLDQGRDYVSNPSATAMNIVGTPVVRKSGGGSFMSAPPGGQCAATSPPRGDRASTIGSVLGAVLLIEEDAELTEVVGFR